MPMTHLRLSLGTALTVARCGLRVKASCFTIKLRFEPACPSRAGRDRASGGNARRRGGLQRHFRRVGTGDVCGDRGNEVARPKQTVGDDIALSGVEDAPRDGPAKHRANPAGAPYDAENGDAALE